MFVEGARFKPGTRVRVTEEAADRSILAFIGYPDHDHYGEVGHVTDVREQGSRVKYEVSFDKWGDECLVFDETELAPAPPRKT